MSPIIAKSESNFQKFPLPEPGTHQAVCCAVWDLGMQKSSFNGKERIQHKIIIAWELDQLIDSPESEYHGKPYMLSKKYTLSLGDLASLRKDLESWRGKPFSQEQIDNGFDVEGLYGINCLIGVTHAPDKTSGKVYANVSALLPPTKDAKKLEPVRQRDEAPPKWVQEKIDSQVVAEETFPAFEDDPFN